MDIADVTMYIYIAFLLLMFGVYVIRLIYEFLIFTYQKTLRYEKFQSTAKVCKKEYVNDDDDDYATAIMVGKVCIPQIHYYDEEYNVYLMYQGEQYCFDDRKLYNSVKIGDTVRVFVHKGYNKKKMLKHVYLSIIKK